MRSISMSIEKMVMLKYIYICDLFMSTCEIARKLFVSVDRKMSFVDIDSSKVVSRLSTCSPPPPILYSDIYRANRLPCRNINIKNKNSETGRLRYRLYPAFVDLSLSKPNFLKTKKRSDISNLYVDIILLLTNSFLVCNGQRQKHIIIHVRYSRWQGKLPYTCICSHIIYMYSNLMWLNVHALPWMDRGKNVQSYTSITFIKSLSRDLLIHILRTWIWFPTRKFPRTIWNPYNAL